MSVSVQPDPKLEAFFQRLRDMNEMSVFIGVLASGEANKPHATDGTRPVTNLDVATWNEFGVEIDGEQHVPERSFLRSTISVEKDAITKRVTVEVRRVCANKQSAYAAYDRIGLAVVGMVQKRIAKGIEPANAPATIEKKGSSKPLIDTGQLRSAITHEVK